MKTKAFLICLLLLGTSALAQSSSEDISNSDGNVAANSFDLTGLLPDDQTSLGKFTTA
ncbi:MAG: hypothetical protein ACJAXK_002749, partial [Yoonia sp.]